MITKVRNNPEDRIVASDFVKIGDTIRLNREQAAITILGISNADTQLITDRIKGYTSDNVIDDIEKKSLARDLETIQRDFQTLTKQAGEANVGNTSEYHSFEESYNTLVALMTRIVNSYGLYSNNDMYDLAPDYQKYTDDALSLGDLIISTQAEEGRISLYYQRVQVNIIVSTEAVAKNSSTTVAPQILFEGNNVTAYVDKSCFEYVVTGLSTGATVSDFSTTETGTFSPVIDSVNHTATITGFKTFSIAYHAVDENGISVNLTLTLDSGSMPF